MVFSPFCEHASMLTELACSTGSQLQVHRKNSPGTHSMTADFEGMAQARGLILPDRPKPATPGKKRVVWDGRAMQIVDDGMELEATNFTYHSGQKMVGYTETPTTLSTKLIHGEHRAINTPAPTKEGTAWKPGCRYSNRVCIHLAVGLRIWLESTPVRFRHPVRSLSNSTRCRMQSWTMTLKGSLFYLTESLQLFSQTTIR